MATVSARPLADEVRKQAERDGIEFVFAQFVDMNAKPSAKLVPMSNWEGLVSEGAGFAGFAAGPIGQSPASPDMLAIPDLSSYTPVPFKPGLARFACDITVEGKEWPYCPRTILRHQLARARELGYSFKIGMELEFFLLREGEGGKLELADPLDRLDQPCYDMKGLTRHYDFLTRVSRYVNQLGWGSYANDHEDANGQFESNFEFADALVTCDRAIFFRYMVHAMAQAEGMLATFMPKPFGHLTGNGGHFHMSLWDPDGQTDLFADPDDPHGLGLSQLAYHFTGGLKKHAKAYIAVTAPTVNSYKRLTTTAGTPTSGATWSPIFITHGANNRTQMLRLPGGHVEDRTVDGSCNPYLAAAVILAAGLDGIEQQIDPGKPNDDNLYELSEKELKRRKIELLPANLLDATRHLEKDAVLREALGNTGTEDYIDYFVKTKQEEWKAYHEQVTPWEINRYLTLF
ncbi:MAG: type III glutamate--ammonia ligase [Gaiellales bacterium]